MLGGVVQPLLFSVQPLEPQTFRWRGPSANKTRRSGSPVKPTCGVTYENKDLGFPTCGGLPSLLFDGPPPLARKFRKLIEPFVRTR